MALLYKCFDRWLTECKWLGRVGGWLQMEMPTTKTNENDLIIMIMMKTVLVTSQSL